MSNIALAGLREKSLLRKTHHSSAQLRPKTGKQLQRHVPLVLSGRVFLARGFSVTCQDDVALTVTSAFRDGKHFRLVLPDAKLPTVAA